MLASEASCLRLRASLGHIFVSLICSEQLITSSLSANDATLFQSSVILSYLLWVLSNLPWVEISCCPTKYVFFQTHRFPGVQLYGALVPSDMLQNNQFIRPTNLNCQKYLDENNSWTNNQKIKINTQKTKTMLFNFKNNHHFRTRLPLANQVLETVT